MIRFFSRASLLAAALAILPAFLAAAEAPAPASPAPAPGPALTLQDCIARALQKNFSLRIQTFSTANARESLIIAGTDFEPTFNASMTRSHVEDPLTLARPGAAGNVDATNSRVGVSQRVVTGATVDVTSNLNRSSSNPAFSSLNPAYNSDVSVAVTQPLLRGAGLGVNRANIERARLGVTIAKLGYKGSVLQVVRDTEVAYYNLAFTREQLAVRRFSLELAQTLLDENTAKRDTGVATDLDVMTARVGVAAAQNNVVLAQEQERNSEDALLALIGQFEFGTDLGAVGFTDDQTPAPAIEEAFRRAKLNQPDYVATENAIKQLELDVQVAQNGRLPTLNVDGALGLNGSDRSFGRTYDRLASTDRYNWQLGLSVSVPWGLRGDRARYRASLNTLHQYQARLQQMEQNLLVQVRSDVRAVDTNLQSVRISTQGTALAQRQYELQKARFDAGLATSRDVLQAQNDLENARVNEIQAKVNLRAAVAELHRLDGSSLDRYNISLAD